ncbi:MAG: C40 family peptidase [Pseudomonadota bacterium]|nr:C40 family peptidase [Pseudomonadota bacterium]
MTSALDRRLNAWRDDLAAEELRGRVKAKRFVTGSDYFVCDALAPLRREHRPDGALDTEALHGEAVTVFEEREGWVWGQLRSDRYVGYLPAASLAQGAGTPTHKVSALRTYVYPGPDIKLPHLAQLSIGSLVQSAGVEGKFHRLATGGYVAACHVARVDENAADFAAVAERFIGTPYLWGGRSSLGLDCSALVQLSLNAAGISSPRDSDLQEHALGRPVPVTTGLTGLERGDLIFWKGHVGIMLDATRLLHANAYHMETAVEPFAVAVPRISAAGLDITRIKRL